MIDESKGPADGMEPTDERPETTVALSQFANLLNKTAVAHNPVEGAAIDLSPEARAAVAEFASLIGKQTLAPENAKEIDSGKTDP